MDNPPWTTLMAAMPGHTRSTFRGARAALNHRFTLVRTPPQSRATHNDKRHSATSNAHGSVQAQKAARETLQAATATRTRTVRTQTDPPPTLGSSRAPPAPIRHMQTRGGFAPPGPQLIFSGPAASARPALDQSRRFVVPPWSCCASCVPIPDVQADLDVGHISARAGLET